MPNSSRKNGHSGEVPKTLRLELQQQLESGQCAYCREPARPAAPLTKEHVIPRARGGRRKDVRIIVPACARCNHHRGSRDLIPFLVSRPQRIAAFLDYLSKLSADGIREIDLRVLGELYAAVTILRESAEARARGRSDVSRFYSGRSLYRRRYAARRAVGSVAARIEAMHERRVIQHGPSCSLPGGKLSFGLAYWDDSIEHLLCRLFSILAIRCGVSGELIEAEMARAVAGTAVGSGGVGDAPGLDAETAGILTLDAWENRPKRKRSRIDQRQGNTVRRGRVRTTLRRRVA